MASKAPPITEAQKTEARRLRLEGVSGRDIAKRLGLGKSRLAEVLATDPELPPRPERPATSEQIDARTAHRVASAVGAVGAIPILTSTAAASRGPRPEVPLLPEGQVATAADHGMRTAYLAELLASEHWQGIRTLREMMGAWRCSLLEVQGYADKARKLLRREYGVDNRQRLVTDQLVALHRIAGKAEDQGLLAVAVTARKAIISTAPPAASSLLAARSLSAEGLPPELAKLKNPDASPGEVAHFASVDAAECTHTGCRVHPRAEGAAVPAPVTGTLVSASSSGPMH